MCVSAPPVPVNPKLTPSLHQCIKVGAGWFVRNNLSKTIGWSVGKEKEKKRPFRVFFSFGIPKKVCFLGLWENFVFLFCSFPSNIFHCCAVLPLSVTCDPGYLLYLRTCASLCLGSNTRCRAGWYRTSTVTRIYHTSIIPVLVARGKK